MFAIVLNGCGAKTGLFTPDLDARATPVDDACMFDGGRGIVQIVAGNAHTCALRGDGTVACWGFNEHGQTGDGTRGGDRTAPVDVTGLSDARAIAAGQHHSCALRADRTVVCWGWNESGQLGDLTTFDRDTPVAVNGVHDAVAVACGSNQSCAVLSNHTVSCWGLTEVAVHPQAQAISGLANVSAVAIGELFACALRNDHAVSCWGWNGRGQLGDGTSIDHDAPSSSVSGLTDAVRLDAGDSYACALRSGGGVSCWGWDDHGQLADGSTATRAAPVVASIGGDVVALATGFDHACDLDRSGTVACWGNNSAGMLGDGTNVVRLAPVAVRGLGDAIGIAAGNTHTCALRRTGAVTCWGQNFNGELGDGTRTDRRVPVAVIGL